MNVDRAQIAEIIVLPDGLKKVFTAENLAAVVYKHLQKVEFLGGQVCQLTGTGGVSRVEIQFDAANVGGSAITVSFNDTVETIELGDVEINE